MGFQTGAGQAKPTARAKIMKITKKAGPANPNWYIHATLPLHPMSQIDNAIALF